MTDGGKPLPSTADVSEPLAEEETPEPEVEAEAASPEPEEKPAARPARPPPPPFKVSTFLYVFLGLLGLWMLIDGSARSSIAGLFGTSPGSRDRSTP